MWCLWVQALLCLDSGSGSSIVAGIWSICGICREKQFEKCFVDESDGAKTGGPSEGGPFYPQDLRGISNSPLQFLSNVSHSVKEWQLNLLKRQIMPFQKVKRNILLLRVKEKQLRSAPPWSLRSGSVSLRRCVSRKWVGFLIPSLQGNTSAWIANVPTRPPPLSFGARAFLLHCWTNNNVQKPNSYKTVVWVRGEV